MSIFHGIFGRKKTVKAEDAIVKDPEPGYNDEVSAFYAAMSQAQKNAAANSVFVRDKMTPREYADAMKSCFPRTVNDFVVTEQEVEEEESAMAMDAGVGGGTGTGGNTNGVATPTVSNKATIAKARQAGVPPYDPTHMYRIPAMKTPFTGPNSAATQNGDPTGRTAPLAQKRKLGSAKPGAGGKKPSPDPYKPNFNPMEKFGINEKVLRHFMYRGFIDWNACALIAQHEFISRACLIPAEDAIAHGYTLECSSDEHKKDEDHDSKEVDWLKNIKRAADEMDINYACTYLDYNKKVFGVGYAIPRVKFKTNEQGEPLWSYEQEFNPSMIAEGSYQGMAVVDPQWLTYDFDEESATDPCSPFFHVPTWYISNMTGTRYHRTWVIKVLNADVPDILKPTYRFGGLPLTQMIYERVFCADKLANEAPLLAMTKRLLIADGNLEQMMADPVKSNKFFRAVNWFRDNFSVFIKKPSSNVTQIDTALTDLGPLTMTQYQLVAAIAQIPVTKLLKNVPSGLQATGDYEWDDYAQSLHSIQENEYRPLLRMHYKCYIASSYPGRNDLKVEIVFNPIDVPKEKEVEQMANQRVQYVANLLNYHLATVAECRSMLRKSPHGSFDALGQEVPAILKAMEEANDPSKGGGDGGGMPGGPMGGGDNGGQGGQGGGQPVDQSVEENKGVFQKALDKVLGNEGAEGAGAEGAGEKPEGEGQSQGQGEGEGTPEGEGQQGQNEATPENEGENDANGEADGNGNENVPAEGKEEQKPAEESPAGTETANNDVKEGQEGQGGQFSQLLAKLKNNKKEAAE